MRTLIVIFSVLFTCFFSSAQTFTEAQIRDFRKTADELAIACEGRLLPAWTTTATLKTQDHDTTYVTSRLSWEARQLLKSDIHQGYFDKAIDLAWQMSHVVQAPVSDSGKNDFYLHPIPGQPGGMLETTIDKLCSHVSRGDPFIHEHIIKAWEFLVVQENVERKKFFTAISAKEIFFDSPDVESVQIATIEGGSMRIELNGTTSKPTFHYYFPRVKNENVKKDLEELQALISKTRRVGG